MNSVHIVMRAFSVVLLTLLAAATAGAQALPTSCAAFADETITPQVTVMKAVHIQQLRHLRQ